MDPIERHALEKEVSDHHGTVARWCETVPVHEVLGDVLVWNGDVHVLDLYGHPFARRAFVWGVRAGKRHRWQIVLAIPPIDNPAAAVRAVLAGASNARPND
jgi:hypothetical protein